MENLFRKVCLCDGNIVCSPDEDRRSEKTNNISNGQKYTERTFHHFGATRCSDDDRFDLAQYTIEAENEFSPRFPTLVGVMMVLDFLYLSTSCIESLAAPERTTVCRCSYS